MASITLGQLGQLASSRSASHTLAPELSALIAILAGLAGPVISTRRSCSATGAAATCQSPSRTSAVSGRKSSDWAAAAFSRLPTRAASSSSRRGANLWCSCSTNASASGVKISSARAIGAASVSSMLMMPFGV